MKVMAKPVAKSARATSPPTRDAEATKAQILDAAEEEFARHGLSGARTEAIAAKTGVTKSMIFYHFGSKEGLYQAVLQRPGTDVIQVFEGLNASKLPPEEALKQVIGAAIHYYSAYPYRGKVLFHEANQNQGRYFQLTGGWEPAIHYVRSLLERGIADGSFKPLNSLVTTIHIMGICSFYFDGYENLKYAATEEDLLSPEMLKEHCQGAIELIVSGIRKGDTS